MDDGLHDGKANCRHIKSIGQLTTGRNVRWITKAIREASKLLRGGGPRRTGRCQKNPAGTLLRERFDRGCFVVLHVKYGVKLGDLQEVVNFLGQV